MTNLSAAENTVTKVLLVSHFYAAHGGGIERVAEKLVHEIISDNPLHFTWIASDCDPQPDEDTLPGQSFIPMRTCNLIEKTLGIPWPLWGKGSLKKLKNAIETADVVWLHDTLYLGNILAFYWANKIQKPVVITQHIGLIPYKNPFFRYLMKAAERLFTFRMLKNATQATFISDCVAEYFYHNIPFTKSIQIIPNGVEVRQYYPPMEEKRAWLRQQFALRVDQPVMLFVGRFVEKKGLSVIRELARLLPEWRFWLAGNGPIQPEKWRLPNVHVFNDRQGSTLAELYQAADLFLLPSYGEGFPLVIQEAMACGLPVLCSPETAAGSQLAEPRLLKAKVSPTSVDETAQTWAGLLRSLQSQLPRKHADYNLAEFASASWGWPIIANAYADILRSVCR